MNLAQNNVMNTATQIIASIDKYDQSHCSPFDCGSADYYYWRVREPHYWEGGKVSGTKITELTPDQVEAYNAGYDYSEYIGERKLW